MRNFVFIFFLFSNPIFLSKNLFSQTIIDIEEVGGVFEVPCKVNGLNLKFIFDTGASDVSIGKDEAEFMIKYNYITEEDIVGTENYQLADGDIVEALVINLKTIEIGNIILENIRASIMNTKAPLLLGQSVIKQLGDYKFDYDSKKLIIGNDIKSNCLIGDCNNGYSEIEYPYDSIPIDVIKVFKKGNFKDQKLNGDGYRSVSVDQEKLYNMYNTPNKRTFLLELFKTPLGSEAEDILDLYNTFVFRSAERIKKTKYVYKGQFRNDKIYDGNISLFVFDEFNDSTLLSDTKIVNGLIEGKFLIKNLDDKIVQNGNYVEGKKEGLFYDNYNGSFVDSVFVLSDILEYKNDTLLNKKIYEYGVLSIESFYQKGILKKKFIYSNGEITEKRTYKEDTQINEEYRNQELYKTTYISNYQPGEKILKSYYNYNLIYFLSQCSGCYSLRNWVYVLSVLDIRSPQIIEEIKIDGDGFLRISEVNILEKDSSLIGKVFFTNDEYNQIIKTHIYHPNKELMLESWGRNEAYILRDELGINETDKIYHSNGQLMLEITPLILLSQDYFYDLNYVGERNDIPLHKDIVGTVYHSNGNKMFDFSLFDKDFNNDGLYTDGEILDFMGEEVYSGTSIDYVLNKFNTQVVFHPNGEVNIVFMDNENRGLKYSSCFDSEGIKIDCENIALRFSDLIYQNLFNTKKSYRKTHMDRIKNRLNNKD